MNFNHLEMAPIRKQKSDGVKKFTLTATDVTPAHGVEEKMSWKEYKKMKQQTSGGQKNVKKRKPNDDEQEKKPMKLTKKQKERHDTGEILKTISEFEWYFRSFKH